MPVVAIFLTILMFAFKIWVSSYIENKPMVYVYEKNGDTVKPALIIDNLSESKAYLDYYNGTSIDSEGFLVINFNMKYNYIFGKCHLIDSTSDNNLAEIVVVDEIYNFKLSFWVKKNFIHSYPPSLFTKQ
jgi:hypothetical protein